MKYTGHYFDNIQPKMAQISKEDALNSALDYFNADEYIWENQVEEELHKRIKKDPNATRFPSPELTYFNKTLNLYEFDFELVYEMDIITLRPEYRGEKVFVSAISGQIINTLPLFHDVERDAKGVSRYSDTVEIVTEELTSNLFVLRDASRGGGVETYDAQSTTNTSTQIDFEHTDTLWDIANANSDEVAIDAHWGAEKTYDYYLEMHNRDSYDNMGTVMLSFVHYNQNWSNAQWSGDRMQYGDGAVGGNPYISIDIVGHEITHGVTQWASGLVYQGESGALNESFSDIFGNAIEHYADSARATWYMGEQCFNTLRNMSFPNEFDDPDTYNGAYWAATGQGAADNGGVHTNSGVQNFWYYLLVEGGAGVNDNDDPYNVNAMGWDAASEIAYLNLEDMLTPQSDYEDAREFSYEVAADLYGDCSPEAENVVEAWYAVGVGRRLDATVSPNFLLNYSYACQLPLRIEFDNLTVGGTTYIWDFGDGSTTLSESPAHNYDIEGEYEITLTSYLDNGCYLDTGSITKTLNVVELGSPTDTGCYSEVATSISSIGINQVKVHSLNYESGLDDEDYNDYTCESNTIMHIDSIYDITVYTSEGTRENVKVWIDYNKDQIFSDQELIFSNVSTYYEHTGTVDFSGIGTDVKLYTPLRMRVISDIFVNQDFSACEGVKNGQTEDYSIVLTDDWNMPLSNILEKNKTSKIAIYPNPTENNITIQASKGEKITKVNIIDLMGKNIMTSSESKIDLTDLSTGTYIAEVHTSNGVYTERIVRK